MIPTTRVPIRYVAILLFIGMWSMGGCATPTSPPKEIATPEIRPAAGAKAPSLMMESEARRLACSQDGSCDRLHFMNALFALQGNSDTAAAHFREVISIAPKSALADLSKSWLKVLATPSAVQEKRVLRDTTDWLLELLKQDKRIEDLSRQLNALKQVDLEMKDKTSRMKPRTPIPAPSNGGSPSLR